MAKINFQKENPEIKPIPHIEPVKPKEPEIIPVPEKSDPKPNLPETEPMHIPEISPSHEQTGYANITHYSDHYH